MIKIKQISALEKVRSEADLACDEIRQICALAGERVCWQISLMSDTFVTPEITAASPLSAFLRLYAV